MTPSSRIGVRCLGLGGALLLHALLGLPLVLDLSLPTPHYPDRAGLNASASASRGEPVMTVLFIEEASPDEALKPLEPENLASRGPAPADLPIRLLSPDPSPAPPSSVASLDRSDPAEAAGDPLQHALLYGRYLGQIQARIERAWLRPRTEIGAPEFSCRARIEQDRHGEVLDIRLDYCNGAERWQRSLMAAIRTASPLPAPTDESVYVDRLWLTFRSDGFQSERSGEGFEPERPETLLAAQQVQAGKSFEAFAAGANANFESNVNERADVVHLTIIGSPSQTPPGLPPPSNPLTEPESTDSSPLPLPQ